MKNRNFFVRFFNLFFISIFVLFFANSSVLLYLSNKDLMTAGREYYNQKAENISQGLDNSLLTPLSGIVFDQFGSFQSSSMMNFLIYEKNEEFATDLSREIATEILRYEWLKSIIVYREDGRIVTDQRMRRNIDDNLWGTQLQGIINCIIKKNSSSGWIAPGTLNYGTEKVLIYYIKYPITDPTRNRGTIIYVIDSSFLADEIRKSIDPTVARAMIEDETGQMLFSYGSSTIPAWINATRPEKLETTTFWKGSDKAWQVIWKPLPYQKISLALVVSSTLFQKNLLYSQRLNFALTLLFIVGLAVYLSFIKNHVQNPLAKTMDALRNMIHASERGAKKSTLSLDTAQIADENRNLIAYRFIISLITEGMEKKDFVHIGEILGLKYYNSPFHIILIERNPLLLQELAWEERERDEENFRREWEAAIPAERVLSIRYPAGCLICLCFVDSAYYLPFGLLFRYAKSTCSNIVFSQTVTETADFPRTYALLVNVLDNKLYYGYGNVFPPEGMYCPVCNAFPVESLKGLLMGGRYEEFRAALIADTAKMEKDGNPPVIMRDYFIRISGLINETYQKKARYKDNATLSYVVMRQEVERLSGMGEFIEWAEQKIRILKGIVQHAREEGNKELIERIQEFIFLSIDKNITQEMVAEHFGISSGYLSRLFREYSPEGFSAFLKECKLREAARRIREKECGSVASLAKKLGYSSPAYFSRQFKKRFGLLPHEYAKCPQKILD
jgi:AraC-like DNA-binding protein